MFYLNRLNNFNYFKRFLTFFAACLILCSFSTSPIRTKPSPYSPNAIPGDTATSAFIIKSLANFKDPFFWYFFGIGAHANMLA